MYDDLLREMKFASFIGWNEYYEIEALRSSKFRVKLFVTLIVLMVTSIISLSGFKYELFLFMGRIMLLSYILIRYLLNVSWSDNYKLRLKRWDDTITHKKFEDVIEGRIKPVVSTVRLTDEIKKLREQAAT